MPRRSQRVNRRPARSKIARALLLLTCAAVAACTGMRPGYETPTVTVNSLRALPAGPNTLPDFEVGLRVINPNPEPLSLRGVAFTVSLDGRDLVKGVGNQLPVIDAYGSGDFKVTASANMLAGIRFLTDLMRSGPKEAFDYELEAKLDIGAFRPALRVRDSGRIELGNTE